MTEDSSRSVLEVRGISKHFGPVQALRNVSVTFQAGRVHALLGENGAGKSTLTKIIGGAHPPDSGELIYHGVPVRFSSPAAALSAGIAVIYQELSLIPELTVAANIFLGQEPRTFRGSMDSRRMRRRANEILELLGAEFDASVYVEDLALADQQLAEIARALNHESAVIIMDEPTASLPKESAVHLFQVIRNLAERGSCVVYISHELEEVFDIADRVTVLKDGEHIITRDVSETSPDDVIRAMVGRSLAEMFPPRPAVQVAPETPALQVEHLTLSGHFEDVSFEVWPGEILGMAGLIGSGRTAVAQAIFGCPPTPGGPRAVSGVVRLHGREIHIRRPGDAIRAGIGYVPEERKTDGLALDLSLMDNIVLPQLERVAQLGIVRPDREAAIAETQVAALGIRAPSVRVPIRNLSGGNQQKAVLGKWLARGSSVLILDDPTRGIDIGAKVETYRILRQLVGQGTAILLISSDLPEVLGLSDRVIIMRKGRIALQLDQADSSEEEVIRAALGAEDSANGHGG